MQSNCHVMHGVDCDSTALRHWAANTGGSAVCVEIKPEDAESLPWPEATSRSHVHLSPPCTLLSKARVGTTDEERNDGADELRWCVEEVVRRGYESFTVENVSTPLTSRVASDMKAKHPDRVDFLSLNAAEYGTPSDRIRLIITSPAIVKRLKEMPVRRISVRLAFEAAGMDLPASHIKNNTRSRDGSPCVRSVEECSQTIVGTHPLTWCNRDGDTVRCLNVRESAVLMGFSADWQLPKGQRVGMLAVGNAIPPPLARCLMEAARAAATLPEGDVTPPPRAILEVSSQEDEAQSLGEESEDDMDVVAKPRAVSLPTGQKKRQKRS